MKHGENHVISGNAMIIWDGVTKPEANDDGKVAHNMKVAILATDPSVGEMQELATKCLRASEFKGQLPQGGNWPIVQCDATKFDGRLAGHVEFNSKTYNGCPQVYDANGTLLNAMQFGQMLFPGAIVQVLIHAYAYNKKGQRGIAFGLDGIRIISTDVPRLPVGGVDAAAAFGSAPVQQPATGAPQMPVQPGYGAPQVPGAPQYGAPQVPVQPQYGAPQVPVQPQYGASQVPVQPGYGAPQVPGVPQVPTQPAYDYLQGPGAGAPQAPVRQLTALAQGASYEQLIAGGWTDETLRANGLML